MRDLVLATIILILLVVPFLSFNPRWRWMIILIFLWLPFEGVARRLVPEFQIYIFFIKDYALIWIYLRILFFERFNLDSKIRKLLLVPLTLFILVTILQLLNPNLTSPIVGLIGLKGYFFYIPLSIVTFLAFNNFDQLTTFVKIVVFLSLPLTIITGFQLLDPTFQFSDQDFTYSLRQRSTNLSEGLALPTSTYIGVGRYSNFMLFISLLGMGFLASTKKNKKFITFFTLIALLGIFISGRRTPMVLIVILSSLFILTIFISSNKEVIFRFTRYILIIITLSVVVSLTVFTAQSDRLTSFYIATFKDDIDNQIMKRFERELVTAPKDVINKIGFLGTGTGMYAQGADTMLGIDKGPGLGSDSLAPKLFAELGLAGILIFLWLCLSIVKTNLYLISKVVWNNWKMLAIALLLYQIAFFVTAIKAHSEFIDSFQQIYFWTAFGLVGTLYKLSDSNVAALSLDKESKQK